MEHPYQWKGIRQWSCHFDPVHTRSPLNGTVDPRLKPAISFPPQQPLSTNLVKELRRWQMGGHEDTGHAVMHWQMQMQYAVTPCVGRGRQMRKQLSQGHADRHR
ncbi:hypothetical protein N7493_001723 [Penicillium malachiteum]|uniref:Uncharacterized protein n=1 Tax=Penicillium malachiteum TaxID=1324776 RepID=A0AAD6HV36_9EURO|nr:hypothetical protein N7493_001723 [Penicillium malachiteum]